MASSDVLASQARLRALPLVTLYLTERCNSRCTSCDYWRHGRDQLSLASVQALLPQFQRLGTRAVLVSGGEPLLHPQWAEIATLLKSEGLQLWLLTAGLALAKHAAAVSSLFDKLTVSMDGADAETYAAIRGVDAFDVVCQGLRAAAQFGRPALLRCTVQQRNFRQLPELVALAHACGASGISFLAADLGNPQAFGRIALTQQPAGLALRIEEVEALERLIDRMETALEHDFRSGFIAESPAKLRRIAAHYRALLGQGEYPPVRCNAPEFSAVLEAGGRLRPCFFIAGPAGQTDATLEQSLNSPAMRELRESIRCGQRPECRRCVCSMWRDPAELARQLEMSA
ncbi:radical SAM protein [Pelomonas sp. SE-A7]|uniref:radical SAM protein n=1 Tax=Pelomonas sp. SE-A7 TaxID=3054953 RepID=UPI00259CF688|nr:radical SAM protein [Pelomonas sp. SE-A7]MDM4765390.1 radical SAM protein [Pelomonas sp. SE-A7]